MDETRWEEQLSDACAGLPPDRAVPVSRHWVCTLPDDGELVSFLNAFDAEMQKRIDDLHTRVSLVLPTHARIGAFVWVWQVQAIVQARSPVTPWSTWKVLLVAGQAMVGAAPHAA